MAKKYIKKLKVPVPGQTGTPVETDLYIKDTEAVSQINGYTVDTTGKVVDSNGNEITFANTPISETDINDVLGI